MQNNKSEEQILHEYKLVQQAQQDPDKFEALYNMYHEPIFRFVYQRLSYEDQAFDITQQVFIKALANIKKYKFKGVPFSAWLFRIASNELNTYFKKNSSHRTINIDTAGVEQMVEDIEEDQSDIFIESLYKSLNSLKADDLIIIEMRYFEKRPFKEIADILSISENNAKVKVYRIIDKLKKQLIVNI